MQAGIREYIEVLKKHGELVTVEKEVDPRDVSALISGSDKAVLLKSVKEYCQPVVGGIMRDVNKIALGLGCEARELAKKMQEAALHPIAPVTVKTAPLKEVIVKEKDVDITRIPWIMQHLKDGGPYIGSGIQFATHEKWGPDAGMYRHMYLTKNTMAVDFNSPNDIRMYYGEKQAKGEALEMAVTIGNHPAELIAATASLPVGTNEMGFAGALRGEAVELIRCESIGVEVPANSEIVLECEVLPEGWVTDEGRYGEFHGVSGDVKRNPIVRVKTITHRRDALFYSLIMPTEVHALSQPLKEMAILNLLKPYRPLAVRAPEGSCGMFELLVSLDHPKPGEGKSALLALLSSFGVKKAVVFDDDIDIFNDAEVRWAEALRVQAKDDLVVVTNCQAKHMDPTVRSKELPRGQLPTTSKYGIDATIPPDIPRMAYEKALYFNPKKLRLQDYL